ncbi:Rha family transcriptional regulator [Serratia fonticola]|uniref:Rha family transcriptional regulator n=1 Tax=Serratia fonticola TaxID=47917 RepID=UPI003F637BB4
MTTILTLAQPEISIANGYAVTTSIDIAEYFRKQHKDVLRKIESLECSLEFTERNFTLSEYIDPTGRKLPRYQITRDGFAFLAMGFTGKKAAKFKEDYIGAFNRMEAKLRKSTPPAQYQILTTLEGDHVVKVEHVLPGKVLLHPSECLEIAKRSGYVVIHYTDLKKMTVDEFLKLGGLAEKTSGVWREKMSKSLV